MSIPTSDSQYLSEASRRMNSGKTEQQRRDELKSPPLWETIKKAVESPK